MTTTNQHIATDTGTAAGGGWVLAASIIASSMAFIDATALNMALPALQADLGCSGAELLWIINGYGVPLAALLLPGGAAADRFGRKATLMAGIGLFAAASIACGFAPGARALVAARFVQGIGAAVMIPGSLALLASSVSLERSGRTIGVWTASSVATTALGPALGGVLAKAGLWRCVFFINVPLALAALAVLRLRVTEPAREASTGPIDLAGGIAGLVSLTGLSCGLIAAAHGGLGDPFVLGSLAVAVLGLIAFVAAEARSAHPILPLSLFRHGDFLAACLLTLAFYSGLYGMTFFLSLNLIQVQGYSEPAAGFAQLPMMVLVVAVSPLAGRLVDRWGVRGLLLAGPAVAGAGFLLLAAPGATAGPREFWRQYLPALAVLGLAMGLTVSPLSTAVMNSIPLACAGLASGINSTLSRLSSVLGIALLGPIVLAVFHGELSRHTEPLGLDATGRSALMAEAVNLAAAKPAAGLPSDVRAGVERAVRLAFVSAFRTVACVCAGAVWLSAIAAAVLFRRQAAAEGAS